MNANAAAAAPTSVTSYYPTYTYNGETYSATALTTSPTAGITLSSTPSNPAGVYYYSNANGTLNLNGVTIAGTLVVNGKLNITGGSTTTITPVSASMPALLAYKQLTVVGQNNTLTVNGLAWVGSGITGSGTNTGSKINVDGSLLIGGASGLGSFGGALNLAYSAAHAAVPNFSNQIQPSVQILTWSQQ
jgi:hypothetical protein